MSLHFQSWKKLTAVAIFAALAGFIGGAFFQEKRIRKANAAIARYPGGGFVREFERYVKNIEYDDDFGGSDFEMNAWFYFPQGMAKENLVSWQRRFEPTLTPGYGNSPDGWFPSNNCQFGISRSPSSAAGVDFSQPLLKLGYYMHHNEGGGVCLAVDKSNHWIRFHSYWGD